MDISEFLRRHGIEPDCFPTVRSLVTEANEMVAGKQREYHDGLPPFYNWQVHYGRWDYQVGGRNSLTEEQRTRLLKITRQIDVFLNGFPFDPETMVVILPHGFEGKCRVCCPDLTGKVNLYG